MTAQGVATRQRILQEAAEVFAELGYGPTTLDQIARQVGVTKGAILRHFGSKEQLFVATYKSVMGSNNSWLDVPSDVREGGFYEVLLFWLTNTSERTAQSLPLRLYFLARHGGDWGAQQQINRFLRAEDPDRTMEFVEFGMARGEIAGTLDPYLVAAMLDWAIDGYQGSVFDKDFDRSGLFRREAAGSGPSVAAELVQMLRRSFSA